MTTTHLKSTGPCSEYTDLLYFHETAVTVKYLTTYTYDQKRCLDTPSKVKQAVGLLAAVALEQGMQKHFVIFLWGLLF